MILDLINPMNGNKYCILKLHYKRCDSLAFSLCGQVNQKLRCLQVTDKKLTRCYKS